MPAITLLDSGKKKHTNAVVMFKKVTGTGKPNTRQMEVYIQLIKGAQIIEIIIIGFLL